MEWLFLVGNGDFCLMYRLTYMQLLKDLHEAHEGACKNKWTRPAVQKFNRKKEENLQVIALSLWFRTYKPRPMLCKIEHKPRKREVFVPAFEDEIVDYLYKIYTDEIYLRLYIQDLYSGIKGRGTKYGVERLEMHIRQESLNYTVPCYVLKGDIKGYYPHMKRQLLLEICLEGLRKMSMHRITKRSPLRWCDVADMDFIEYLTTVIALLDPTENCKRVSPLWEWDDLPPEKSFFHMEKGRGVPPGKLTSGTFGNMYLNGLDHHMKRDLHFHHIGRFTDDFYVVSSDREFLLRMVPEIDLYLRTERGLELHKGKTRIFDVRKGVPFLGAFLMPHRRYMERRTLKGMRKKLVVVQQELREGGADEHANSSINSYLGLARQFRGYNLARSVMLGEHHLDKYGIFTLGMKKFIFFSPLVFRPDEDYFDE